MIQLRRRVKLLLISIAISFVAASCTTAAAKPASSSAEEYRAQGDQALSERRTEQAIDSYRQGIRQVSEDDSLTTEVSLHTNLATALSSAGDDQQAAESYQDALLAYKKNADAIVEPSTRREVTLIAAQSAFFLGMVYQDLGQPRDAADAYVYAQKLDPNLWAAAANLGSVLHDMLSDHTAALEAYNRAYSILTNTEVEPTDPPPKPRPILSQLQYRIGLCIGHDKDRKCAMVDDPDKPVDCDELATHAFSLAVQFDAENESAAHMLATMTADATVKRASNTYVKSLFDDYASTFEHSLVEELGYTGYERLRRGFDRAFDGQPPTFDLVVDAGCGTGLVGEQFRNVSKTLIGVDLSEAIIEQAVKSRPGLYDETHAQDVLTVFRERKPISFIVAGDSYIYFGDLDPLFEAMREGLEGGGYAAFTLENVDAESEASLAEAKPEWRWQLTPSGRFAHRKEYVVSVGADHDLHLIHYEPLVDFRYERGVGVRGHIFVMRKGRKDQEL